MQDPRFHQDPYRCRLDWGRRAAREAAERGNAIVVVDVLRFSSAVATAVYHGAEVYPCGSRHEAAELAPRLGASILPREGADPSMSGLSPRAYMNVAHGERVVIASINGGHCADMANKAPVLFAASLLNAGAVSEALALLLNERPDLDVTVVACGERWHEPNEDGALRFAVEDYLAAGAVLLDLPHEKSPEASLAAAAFLRVENDLMDLLLECGSGRELRAAGRERDVRDCSRLNLYDAAPVLREGRFVRWQPSMARTG